MTSALMTSRAALLVQWKRKTLRRRRRNGSKSTVTTNYDTVSFRQDTASEIRLPEATSSEFQLQQLGYHMTRRSTGCDTWQRRWLSDGLCNVSRPAARRTWRHLERPPHRKYALPLPPTVVAVRTHAHGNGSRSPGAPMTTTTTTAAVSVKLSSVAILWCVEVRLCFWASQFAIHRIVLRRCSVSNKQTEQNKNITA